ncbi:hypothetical protein BYT27DRAFT_7226771 [Phlegmacium glaucopus]|nr:hypothetical protein BYT27DRAFT_7226771 [Phlegmacium glaucopus]
MSPYTFSLEDHQLAADALQRAFLINFVADLERRELDFASDLEDSDDNMDDGSSSDSCSTSATPSSKSSDNSDDPDFMTPAEIYVHHMANLYSERYMAERTNIPKTWGLMHLLLNDYKVNHPQIFRNYLRIDRDCFDALVEMPVEQQVVIALFCFGHYGNAASIMKVAFQFGVGFGTVHLVTMHWANDQMKSEAKDWIEGNSCPAWWNGWLMVDGTLLVSMPNCDIIDYSVGLPGSQHDATAWEETRICQQHNQLLANDEWVWADSAYPLKPWCQSPYKKPEKLELNNAKYNYHLSAVWVCSEHCVGYVKGRWGSLRGLRVSIKGEKGIQYAMLWIITCIHLHAFAMQHKQGEDLSKNEFFQRGKRYQKEQQHLERRWQRDQRENITQIEDALNVDDDVELLRGKIKRELKEKLFDYMNF